MASLKRLLFSLLVCVLSVLLAAVCATKSYQPKGRLIEPPPRLSLWRYGYNTPKYKDNQLSCYIRKEKPPECGFCGETSVVANHLQITKAADNAVKIVRTYLRGKKIKVGVLLITPTVRHGWFQFELCQKCTPYEPETDTCFERHILKVLALSRIDPSLPIETRLAAASDSIHYEEESLSEEIDEREHGKGLYSIPSDLPPDSVLVIELQLPINVFCDACVLRWKYVAGKHQRLYGCADVRIIAPSFGPSKNLQWVNGECVPKGAAIHQELGKVIIVRHQTQSNPNIPILTANLDSSSVKPSIKRDILQEAKVSLNGYYPGIMSQIARMYPHVYRHKLEAGNGDNLTESMSQMPPIDSRAPLAVRNLNLPSPLCFYFIHCFFKSLTE